MNPHLANLRTSTWWITYLCVCRGLPSTFEWAAHASSETQRRCLRSNMYSRLYTRLVVLWKFVIFEVLKIQKKSIGGPSVLLLWESEGNKKTQLPKDTANKESLLQLRLILYRQRADTTLLPDKTHVCNCCGAMSRKLLPPEQHFASHAWARTICFLLFNLVRCWTFDSVSLLRVCRRSAACAVHYRVPAQTFLLVDMADTAEILWNPLKILGCKLSPD